MSLSFMVGAILGSGAAIAFGREPLARLIAQIRAARASR